MTELESLALLLADLNRQVRALQQQNAQVAAERDDLLHRLDKTPGSDL